VSKKPGSDAPKSKPKPEYETDPLGKLNPGFCEFYAIWPRRVKRKDAFRAYLKMVKSDSDHELLVTKTRQAVAGIFASRQLDKVPHPSTWINSLDWKDDTADLSDPTTPRGTQTQPSTRWQRDEPQGFDYDILGSGWGREDAQ